MSVILILLTCSLVLAFGRWPRKKGEEPSLQAEFQQEKKRLFAAAEKPWWDRFDALPEAKKRCRFSLLRVAVERTCDNAFACSTCGFGKQFLSGEIVPRQLLLADDAEVAGIRLPGHLFFHRGHTWVRVDEDGLVRVGLDDFARRSLGPDIRVNAQITGTIIEQGEASCLVDKGPASVPVLAPVDGRIVSVNRAVLDHPELLHRDPYGEGWLYRIKPYNLFNNLRSLLRGVDARVWMEEEFHQLTSVVLSAGTLPRAADGGHLVEDLSPLWEGDWGRVNRSLLLSD